jgi:hypothetical protein
MFPTFGGNMRFEKTKKGAILGLATVLLAGGAAFGTPTPAQAPNAPVVVTSEKAVQDLLSLRLMPRESRSSDRTTPPQKKNIVVKKKNSVVKKAKPVKVKPKKVKTVKSGSNRALGKEMAARKGWTGAQWVCLEKLWTHESNWNHKAYNSSSGAGGIPQSLPASKMASAGADWKTNPATQIKWGLKYIDGRYGSPCKAYGHFQSNNWY